MTKGTPSMGKKSRRSTLVQNCRRCGGRSYHIRNKICSSCGYGKTAKLRRYNWQKIRNGKTVKRK
ncbi:MAG TPA: 50S ribosomal protein L37e [Candidatus Nanoarchaeia archaeon]|nr:50S ribosomal protein L37e [Candidatus Nanoarchaeia archaeon]